MCFVFTIPEHHRQYLRSQLIFCGEDILRKKKTEGSCVKKHIKTCQGLRNLKPKEQTGRRFKCQQRHGGSQDMEDSRTQSTGLPDDRGKEYTMKQRRGWHQEASGYWKGEQGSRWIFEVYDSDNLCLSIWIAHQRGNSPKSSEVFQSLTVLQLFYLGLYLMRSGRYFNSQKKKKKIQTWLKG